MIIEWDPSHGARGEGSHNIQLLTSQIGFVHVWNALCTGSLSCSKHIGHTSDCVPEKMSIDVINGWNSDKWGIKYGFRQKYFEGNFGKEGYLVPYRPPVQMNQKYIYFIDLKQYLKKNAVHGRARAWKLKNKGKFMKIFKKSLNYEFFF